MYHRKEKKSDFLQVHEAAAKLSGSPSALYVLSAELGWGLWLQISSPGAARSMEGMLGIPPVSLCSHQGGGTGGWQRGCSSEGAARTGACSGDKRCSSSLQAHCVPRAWGREHQENKNELSGYAGPEGVEKKGRVSFLLLHNTICLGFLGRSTIQLPSISRAMV